MLIASCQRHCVQDGEWKDLRVKKRILSCCQDRCCSEYVKIKTGVVADVSTGAPFTGRECVGGGGCSIVCEAALICVPSLVGVNTSLERWRF